MPEEIEGYPKDRDKQLAFWKRQIEYGKKYYEPYFVIGDTLLKIVNNVASNFRERAVDDLLPSPVSRVKAGIVFAWLDQSISNLQERNPRFSIEPQNRESVGGASAVRAAVNYWHGETKQYEQDDRCLLDGNIYHWFVKKVGWNARILDEERISLTSIAEYSEDDPENAAQLLAAGIPLRAEEYQNHDGHIEACTMILQDPIVPREVKESLVEPYISDHKRMLEKPQADQNVTIQYDAPYALRWNPKRFLLDPDAEHGLRDAQWIAFGWTKTLFDVKNDRLFENTDDVESKGRSPLAPGEDGTILGYDDFGIVEGWEVWSRNFPTGKNERHNLRLILTEDHDKFLRYDEEWPFEYIEDYPAVVGTFHHDVDSHYNKPLLALAGADNLQMLTNEMLDSILSVVRKEKNVIFYDKDAFAEIGDGQFENILQAPEGSAFAIEGLKDMKGPPVVALPFNRVQQDKLQLSNIMQGLFDRVLGTAEPLRSRSSDTATQANLIDRRISSRENRRANIFKNFQIETAQKFWQLHQQFLPARQFLIDPRTDFWADVTEEVAKGEYRFRIDISSAAQAQTQELQRWQTALNIVAGVSQLTLQLYGVAPNILKIIEQLFVKGLGIQDVENYLPIDPAQGDKALAETMADPAKRMMLLDAILKLKGGGDMVSGMGPGPINPQLYASRPQTEADELTRANR